MKEKKKLSLVCTDIHCTGFGGRCRITDAEIRKFCGKLISSHLVRSFLNLLKFIVVPIVLFSIMCGIISMKDIKKVGSIGAKTVVYICVRQHLPLHSDLLGQICSKEHFRRLRQQIFLIKQIRLISLMDTYCKYLPIKFCITDGGGKYAPGDRDGTDSWIWNYPSGGKVKEIQDW